MGLMGGAFRAKLGSFSVDWENLGVKRPRSWESGSVAGACWINRGPSLVPLTFIKKYIDIDICKPFTQVFYYFDLSVSRLRAHISYVRAVFFN